MKSTFGIIGLGMMGKNLALNVLDKGHSLSVYNRSTDGEENLISDFLDMNSGNEQLHGFTQLESFTDSIETPKKILLMIRSGLVVDSVIDVLSPFLKKGDILIDGGNSHYKDTFQRYSKLQKLGIEFVDCGVSGGEEGARKGPSLMLGGSQKAYQQIAPILESIAAKDKNGNPCCQFIGSSGAGHFIKMTHNGIEYAEMQLIAEAFHILSQTKTNEQISKIFIEWNNGELKSYLLEITIDILRKKEGNNYLIDLILDKAENKGTGSWASQASMEYGIPATMMTDAVFARYISSFKSERLRLSNLFQRKNTDSSVSEELIKNSYQFARILNHHQGFVLIKEASIHYNWNIDFSEVARIWTNGCIIRSILMEECVENLKDNRLLTENATITKRIGVLESSCSDLVTKAISLGLHTPVFSSAIQYWLGMTSDQLPANMIQAQRDYFGAHTYKRVNNPSGTSHHTNWNL